MTRSKMTMIALIAALISTVPVFAAGRSARGVHKDGWELILICPQKVGRGDTCEMQARLKGLTVPAGREAIVKLTIADRDLFKDDVVLTRTYRFKAGQTVQFLERKLCGRLKKDVGRKSEIYAKVEIRVQLAHGVRTIVDYRATVKTPVTKVTTAR